MEDEKKTEVVEKKYKFKEPTYWWITLIVFLVELLVAAGMGAVTLWLRDYFNPNVYIDTMNKYRYWADAFTIPGVLYVCIGLLYIFDHEGAFDGLGYVLRRAARVLLPFFFKKDKTYAEYIEERRARQKTIRVFSLLIVGGVLLGVAVIFIILFFKIYNGNV